MTFQKKPSLDDILGSLREVAKLKQFFKLRYFEPYPKQKEFFGLGATMRERLLIAGNRLGKTEAGAVEATYHLTGRYPEWWEGRRWTRPTIGWAAGESSTVVRNVQQTKLCGPYGVVSGLGTGYIPKEDFADAPSLARGVTDAYDTIQVWHHDPKGVRDGISTLAFKSYEQGRAKFQGDDIDFGWADEEADEDIYTEMLARIGASNGMVYTTFTPLKGRTKVVDRFLSEKSPDRSVTTMTIYDALHFTDEMRKKTIAGYPEYQRDARVRGIPILGSGRIFPYSDDMIAEDPLTYVPDYWAKLWGIDFGIGHPFGAALLIWDKDNDIIHVHHAFRMRDALPINHAAAMKPIGAAVPVAWPQDGQNREKSSGDTLIKSYRKEGLLTLDNYAEWEGGGNSTEAGILEMQARMTTGRFKVARHLLNGDWGEEFRLYHRKDGEIVKERDDILSATRIALMAKRFARTVPLGGKLAKRNPEEIADGVDFDLF